MKLFKRALTLTILAIFTMYSHAQSIDEIKKNSNYIWGEGNGTTMSDAEGEALRQMSVQISVSVYNSSYDEESNDNSVQKAVLQSVSSAKFHPHRAGQTARHPDADGPASRQGRGVRHPRRWPQPPRGQAVHRAV